jgi:NitT/TauT family transport system substrate-binding protein
VRQTVGNAPGAFEFVKQGRIAGFIATSDTVFQLQADKQPVVAWSTDEFAPCPGQVYMTSRTTFDKDADVLVRFLRAVEDCIGAMLATRDNLEPVVASMAKKYEIVEAKRPNKGIPVLRNGLQHTFAAPFRDKLSSSPARWNAAYDLMVRAKIVPPMEKRDIDDDRVRKLAFG